MNISQELLHEISSLGHTSKTLVTKDPVIAGVEALRSFIKNDVFGGSRMSEDSGEDTIFLLETLEAVAVFPQKGDTILTIKLREDQETTFKAADNLYKRLIVPLERELSKIMDKDYRNTQWFTEMLDGFKLEKEILITGGGPRQFFL